MSKNSVALISEFLGTFALVLVGTGAIVLNDVTDGAVTHLGISIAFGAIVTAMIIVFGSRSGAHINPAVTIGFWMADKFNGSRILPYILMQIAGGVCASFLLYLLFPEHQNLGATLPHAGVELSALIEFGMTAFLMLVILYFSSHKGGLKRFTALAVGATVGLEAYFGGSSTGASMNPARSLGPSIVSGVWDSWWIYVFFTTLGAVLVSLLWKKLSPSSQ